MGVLSGICLDELKKTTKTSVRIAGLRAGYELGTTRIRSRITNHSFMTFGY
jgi:hypothetical protein